MQKVYFNKNMREIKNRFRIMNKTMVLASFNKIHSNQCLHSEQQIDKKTAMRIFLFLKLFFFAGAQIVIK